MPKTVTLKNSNRFALAGEGTEEACASCAKVFKFFSPYALQIFLCAPYGKPLAEPRPDLN